MFLILLPKYLLVCVMSLDTPPSATFSYSPNDLCHGRRTISTALLSLWLFMFSSPFPVAKLSVHLAIISLYVLTLVLHHRKLGLQ